MGRNVLRGYVFDPLESYYIGDTKTKGVLTMQLDLEPNLNNPAEISWGKDFKKTTFRADIVQGKPHIHFGDFDSPESYKGSFELGAKSMENLLECRGRSINGWGEMLYLIDEAIDLGENIITMRPGEEAETVIREFLKPFSNYS